ncbi:ADP-ribosylation factor-like protein 1 [Colletotrichum scovillei]|uniref:ADP-ribosylation factor-like protein 1 n=1 Tax=Colletotrichum scovillei TaxID=1209932 RepID=UPI0015C37716|nr:ADP-ribosylation factor-like protein 1 [Colletotrichum scovillei]KAF4782757.1 ADP-ribosylation factor-like protein 1 [Colletotrichum scovillei]
MGGIWKTHVGRWVPVVVVVVAAVRLGLVTLSVAVARESSLVVGAEEEEEEEKEALSGGWKQPAASLLPQVLEEPWQQTPSGGMQPSQQGIVDPGQTVPSSMGGWDGEGVGVDWEVAAAVKARKRKRRDVELERSILVKLCGAFLGVSGRFSDGVKVWVIEMRSCELLTDGKIGEAPSLYGLEGGTLYNE